MLEQTLAQKQLITPKNEDSFDIIIIGAGPAGMSAAVCAARANLKILVIEKALPGGQTSTAYIVDNYLGFSKGILGEKLAQQMEAHMNDYKIHYTMESVEDIHNINKPEKIVKTDLGGLYKAKAIIIAIGLQPKKLELPFEQTFIGRGISYYAKGDVSNYRDQDVAVIGGGNCAAYAADYLSEFVNKVYLIHHSDDIKAVKSLKDQILNNPKIIPMWNSRVIEAFGIDKVEKIKLQNITNDQTTWIDVKGVFVYCGRIPPQPMLNLDIRMDEEGYIVTDEYMRTNIRGVYAAGDIRAKQIRQIPTAVADGMIAAINAERDLYR